MDIYNPVKTCSKCGIEKPVSEFNKNKTSKDGLQRYCISCVKEYKQDNKEKIKEYHKQYGKNYNRIISEDRKEYMCNYNKTYYENNKEFLNDRNKERNKINRKRYNERERLNRLNNPMRKLKHTIRVMLNNRIRRKGFKKNRGSCDIIGCDWDTFKIHIESKFTSEMNWDNHGTYWDIDHIIPVSSACTEEEVLLLNHYTNLQPLESNYNRNIKRNKIL